MATTKISTLQKDFLRRNPHLRPVGRLDARTIIVRDAEARNDFGEKPAYVLTGDCKVQRLETFVAHLPDRFLTEPI
jgi:hypothetical protein